MTIKITHVEDDLNGLTQYTVEVEGIEGTVLVAHDTVNGEWDYYVDGQSSLSASVTPETNELLDEAEEEIQAAIEELDELVAEEWIKAQVFHVVRVAEAAALRKLNGGA